jgi:hypothetical protein
MLWMVVVGILLAILKALGLTTVGLVIVVFWVAITAAVRVILGSAWAHLISAGGGSILAVGLLFTGFIAGSSLMLFIILAVGIPFVFVELAWFGVSWLDEILRAKPEVED